MTLGYIISDEKIEPENNFEVISYSQYDKESHSPALLVGYDKIKELFGDTISILDRKINDDTYWTFTLDEHRSYHDLDTYEFSQHCYGKIVKDVNYYFIDPLLMSEDKHQKMFDKIEKKDDKIITFHHKDMIYIYTKGFILGINIMFYEFIGDDREKIISKIKKLSDVFLQGNEIIIEYKDYMSMYENDYKYIPYLYSIINDER